MGQVDQSANQGARQTGSKGVKRRELLVRGGLLAAGLGLSEASLMGWASQYQQAAAQGTRRRLALLIGINAYPSSVLGDGQDSTRLSGCLTDLALQRELLVYRFGFRPEDILTLTDQRATRVGIISAFMQHLQAQAQPGDVVVVHFSGYGTQVRLSDRVPGSEVGAPIPAWVPYDGTLPTRADPILNDLSEATVKQLLKTLKTQAVTTVIDAGFTAPERPLAGGFRGRSRLDIPTGETFRALPELADLAGKPVPQRFPGLLLRAGTVDQIVAERTWDGFSTGLFTYALTRQLWEVTAPLKLVSVLGQTREAIQPLAPQIPQRAGEAESVYGGLEQTQPADGVVIEADSRSANVWLGGLPPEAVPYGGQSWFAPVDGVACPARSRSELTVQVDLPEGGAWPVGTAVTEAIRVLPRQIALVVAIDSSLARIERVDATSALAALPFISSTAAPTQLADCLFGRPPAEPTQTASLADVPQSGSLKQGYGLFLPTRDLLPGTLAQQDEAIKAAVSRLTPKLQTLLAMKLLRLTANPASSRLAVRLQLEMTYPQETLLLLQETLRPAVPLPRTRAAELMSRDRPCSVATGSRIRYRLLNFNPIPLYFVFVSLDARDRMIAFVPPPAAPADSQTTEKWLQASFSVRPDEAVSIPTEASWGIEDPIGRVETLLICSTIPFPKTVRVLATQVADSSAQRVDLGDRALEVAQAILADLHAGNPEGKTKSASDTYALNAATWATLKVGYSEVA